MDTGEIAKEFFANYIPIWAKSVPGLRDVTESSRNNPITPIEQYMGANGIHSSRYSPITETYKLASEYKQAAGLPKDTGVYPVSKYSKLRYALEDADMERARAEYDKLIESGEKRGKISDGFRESINHPFTSSKADDIKFQKSLSPEDRVMYDAAVNKRREILRRFAKLRH